MRDKNNNKRMLPIRRAFGDFFEQIDIVEADCLNAESMDRAV